MLSYKNEVNTEKGYRIQKKNNQMTSRTFL